MVRYLKGHKTLGKLAHFRLGPLSFKLRVPAKQASKEFMHSFLRLINQGNLPFPALGHTHLWHCYRLKSGRRSKAAKRLGDFLQTEWGLRLCQSWGARVHHPLFYSPPSPPLRASSRPCLSQVVLPLWNLTRHWLTGHALGAKQGEVKWAEATLLPGR